MMRKVLMVLVIMSMASSAQAGGPRDHEPGFFLRLSTGIGGARTGPDTQNVEERFSGWTGDPNFAIGGTVRRDLALHATLLGWSTSHPTFESGSVEIADAADVVFLGALGIGITYFVMPLNLYLSPSIGFGRLVEVFANDTRESEDLGVAFDFTVGKEWWVSDRWALGVAGGLGLHSIPDDGYPYHWKGSSFAVRFTSTFN